MKTWKKVGVTALAGSMVAFSAQAVDVSVTGSMKMTYTADSGAQDNGVDGGRWGMSKAVALAGSGEMDNGWTVSLTNSNLQGSHASMSIDMGDAGTVKFQNVSGGLGIGTIDDMMPTADEDVGNGIDVHGSGTVGVLSGTVSGGTKGFNYTKTLDMVELGLGYAPKGAAGSAQGGVSGDGGNTSGTSGYVKIDPMDGLEIGLGLGEVASATANQTTDHSTMYATYVYGSFTFGVQQSEVDHYGSTADDEQTRWGILYALNDEMSVSYQAHENDDTTATDEDADGWSASYTSGGMTIKAHRNSADNVGNITNNESEHTEVGVTFAF